MSILEKGVAMPGREDLPAALLRSPRKAQDTWVATHDSALDTYGPGRRAQQLGIQGRSRMSKAELVDALDKANRRETARARK
jgi:hypothetical protein